jgi:hypothetical protein
LKSILNSAIKDRFTLRASDVQTELFEIPLSSQKENASETGKEKTPNPEERVSLGKGDNEDCGGITPPDDLQDTGALRRTNAPGSQGTAAAAAGRTAAEMHDRVPGTRAV